MQTRKIIFVFLSLISFAGCATHGPENTSEDAVTASDEVDRLRTDLKAARENGVDVLAPEAYDSATDAVDRAQTSPTRAHFEKARELLKSANAKAAEWRDRMGPALDARQDAMDAHAVDLAPNDFKAAEQRFKDFSRAQARQPASDRQSGFTSIIGAYQKAQAEAHVVDLLRKARETQDQARREDAEKWAPRSWRETEMALEIAGNLIRRDPYLSSEASIAALKAEKAAEHLLSITRLSQSLKGQSWEDIALKLEDQDLRIQDFALKTREARGPAACEPERKPVRKPADPTTSGDPTARSPSARP